jgi:hypothetical protein
MIGSVYDPGRGRYRYYQLRVNPGRPWQQPGSAIGTGVEDALPQLPLGSVPVGEGTDAVGPVLRASTGLRPLYKYAAVGLAAAIAWRWFRG